MPPRLDPTDLVGRTFTRLTVERVLRHTRKGWLYHCRCACGNPATAYRYQLLAPDGEGSKRSCGCLYAEHLQAKQQYLRDHARMQAEGRQQFYARHRTPQPVD